MPSQAPSGLGGGGSAKVVDDRSVVHLSQAEVGPSLVRDCSKNQVEIDCRSLDAERMCGHSDSSILRRSVCSQTLGQERRRALELRSQKCLLPTVVRGLDTVFGVHKDQRDILSMECLPSGILLGASSLYFGDTGIANSQDAFARIEDLEILGRFFGGKQPRKIRRGSDDCREDFSRLGCSGVDRKISIHRCERVAPSGFGDKLSDNEFTNPVGQVDRSSEFCSKFVDESVARCSSQTKISGEFDRKVDFCSIGFKDSSEVLLESDRRSSSSDRMFRLGWESNVIDGFKDRSSVVAEEFTSQCDQANICYTDSTLVHRCVDVGLGSASAEFGLACLSGLDSRRSKINVTHDIAGIVGHCQGGGVVAGKLVSDDSNGQYGSKKVRQRAGRKEIGKHDSSIVLAVQPFCRKTHSSRELLLDSFKSELGRRQAFPPVELFNARCRSTMARYVHELELFDCWLKSKRCERSAANLALYLSSLHTKHQRYALQILAGIKHCLTLLGDFNYTDPRLKMTAEGVVRYAPIVLKPQKSPIRWFHLEALYHAKKDALSERDFAIFVLGLFCYLRPAETASLEVNSFTVLEDSIVLKFKRLKQRVGDPLTTVWIRDIKGLSFSPVNIIRNFLKNRAGKLFLTVTGKELSSDAISKVVKHRMIALGFSGVWSGHCLRVGAACFAAERGLSITEIKSLGGWKSDTFVRYIRDIVHSFGT